MENNSDKNGRTIVLTGGGTAGHVTPNMALIPHLKNIGFTNIHYVGTNGIEKELISGIEGVTFHEIPAGKLRRYISLKNLTDPFKVIKGISESKKILSEIRPDVVFSKGGYVSVPVVMAAAKIAPVVAHESDYTPGIATKISAKFASRICVSFEDTLKCLPKGKAVHTGSPIRDALFEGNAERGRQFLGFTSDKPVFMIMGGSLGAQAVNEAVRASLSELTERFNIVHICGKGKADESFSNYAGYVQLEYVKEELPDIFAAADMVLSRAGANSVFELLALAKPSVLVPLPGKNSRGDQILNAAYFRSRGYSEVLTQELMTRDTLLKAVFDTYDNRETYINAMQADKTARDGLSNVLEVIKSQLR